MSKNLLKLNLGCGNKPLKGYVNVDKTIPSGYDDLDFIVDDVTVLSDIADESCSEIIAYHLLEHLPQHLVENTLFMWRRKLVTGGSLILELPDILKCCRNVIEGFESRDEFKYLRLGLIGIYGDISSQAYKSHMEHLWGYTPQSLAKVLDNVGFKNTRFEDPISKPEWSKHRDMRCITYK
jgi:hypothetical protein